MAAQVVEIYGIQVIQQFFKTAPEQCLEFFCVNATAENPARLALLQDAEALGIKAQPIRKTKLDQVTQGGVHQGVLARVRVTNLFGAKELKAQLENEASAVNQESAPLFLFLDGVTDPHNLGACLRTAEAVGVNGVVVPRRGAAPITSVVRKVACGAAERVNLYQVGSFVEYLKAGLDLGYQSVAMVADTQATSLYDLNLSVPTMLVLGAEGPGIRPKVIEACSIKGTIPMQGALASVNVSVAAGIVLFETLRQRLSLKKD